MWGRGAPCNHVTTRTEQLGAHLDQESRVPRSCSFHPPNYTFLRMLDSLPLHPSPPHTAGGTATNCSQAPNVTRISPAELPEPLLRVCLNIAKDWSPLACLRPCSHGVNSQRRPRCQGVSPVDCPAPNRSPHLPDKPISARPNLQTTCPVFYLSPN